jgi:hypothetical protein
MADACVSSVCVCVRRRSSRKRRREKKEDTERMEFI